MPASLRLLSPLGSRWFLAVSWSWQVCQRGLRSSQVGREAWSAMFMICGLVDGGFLMTINCAPAESSAEATLAAPANASAALAADGAVPCQCCAADYHPGAREP